MKKTDSSVFFSTYIGGTDEWYSSQLQKGILFCQSKFIFFLPVQSHIFGKWENLCEIH